MVGTDVAHAAVLLWVAALAHLVSGNVDLALAGTLLLGSIPGVWLGANLSTRLPERGLRPALGIVMFTSGLALLTKAGVGIPAIALVDRSRSLLGLGVLRDPAPRRYEPGSIPRASSAWTTCAADSSALSAVVSRRTSACSGGS